MKGAAATADPPAPPARDHRSEPRLAIAQVNEVLTLAQASDAERDAAWERLRTAQGVDLTAEWLVGWVDGYRTGQGAHSAQPNTTPTRMRSLPPPKRQQRG